MIYEDRKQKNNKTMSKKNKKHKAIKDSKRILGVVHRGRHKRKFRYALKDINECNWVLRDTSGWWEYIASYFW